MLFMNYPNSHLTHFFTDQSEVQADNGVGSTTNNLTIMSSTTNPDTPAVSEPFPIFRLAHRFLLYDPNTIAYVREKYNICGVLIGALPQAPQQNVFSGVPLELMPEETRILVEKKVAYIEDDVKTHRRDFLDVNGPDNGEASGLSPEERRAYQASLRKQSQAVADQVNKKSEDRKAAALSKLNAASGDWNDLPEDMLRPRGNASSRSTSRGAKKKPRAIPSSAIPPLPNGANSSQAIAADDDLLFGSSSTPVDPLPKAPRQLPNSATRSYAITPTTSYPPLKPTNGPPMQGQALVSMPSGVLNLQNIETSSSYSLFKHIHSKGYFLAPGMRFGCQYMAYPGDPLRFHSHFLCNGMNWEEEFDLLGLVGGGRLGTGVKKGFLIGGRRDDGDSQPPIDEESDDLQEDIEEKDDVRAFCIEWAGM